MYELALEIRFLKKLANKSSKYFFSQRMCLIQHHVYHETEYDVKKNK